MMCYWQPPKALATLGGIGGYYYTSAQAIKTKTIPVTTTKKDIDYEKIYKEIAEMLDENPEWVQKFMGKKRCLFSNSYDDGSYGPVLVRLAWHASGTYDKETKTGGSNGATMSELLL